MAYYVFDDAKNLFEGMTREQIVNAIANATGLTPEEIDADVITSAIKEQNAQKNVNLWIGTQNEYNAIAAPDENTLYVVTDPHETNELQSQINQLQSEVDNIVAASTTNASGYIIEKLESDPQPLVYNSTFQWYEVANNFVVPEGAEILEYCWKRYEADNHTNDIYASRESDTVVKVVYHSAAQEVGNFILSLVISYPQAITLPELTDIRVGYDGTVYDTAGEAVRRQIFKVGFNDYVKQALLNLLAHVAYTDQNGQQYYNALERAMYMLVGVTSITAVFDQGANVIYDTDDLDALRQYLTVTAYYEDNTHEVITGYILSGTLEVGTSTITVSYGGKTATFDVTVTKAPLATFESGALAKGTNSSTSSYRYIWKTSAAARARMTTPIANNNYVFTVTDSTKYSLAAYDPETLEITSITVQNVGTVDAYHGGTKSISWAASDSATTDYVWLALKKNDGTDFTEEELANAEGTVFTYTEGT